MIFRVALVLAVWLLPAVAWGSGRFAIILGNDEGASGRPRLWYAHRDAARFARTLTELGDFPGDQVVFLKDARLPEVRRQLAVLESRIGEAQKRGERTLLLFYFSGHANDVGLELGPDQLPFSELRAFIMQSQSNARVAVVDACGAGALTQVKGGRAWSGVDFPLPSEDAEGVAFLASTALGEPAQESSRLEGSFFTTHLDAAIRGAADLDGDGRVTLTEAFLYTRSRTTSETSQTSAGPQHPTYDTHMSGRGDVVLADLRRAEATLVLPPAEGSTYSIRGRDQFFAEVPGGAQPIRLALPVGTYSVDRHTGDAVQTTDVTLARGDQRPLPPMSAPRVTWGLRKGMTPNTEVSAGLSIASGLMVHAGGAWSGRVAVARVVGPVRIRLLAEAGRQSVADDGLNYDLTSAGGALALLVPLIWMPARVEVGAQGGADWMHQTLQSGETLNAVAGHWEGLALLSYPLGFMRVGTEFSCGLDRLPLNGGFANRFAAAATLIAGTEF